MSKPSSKRKKLKISVVLDNYEQAKFRALAARLDLTLEDAAKRFLMATVDALEPHTNILWPIYLVQAGDKVLLDD